MKVTGMKQRKKTVHREVYHSIPYVMVMCDVMSMIDKVKQDRPVFLEAAEVKDRG